MKLSTLFIFCLFASVKCFAQTSTQSNAAGPEGLSIDSSVAKNVNSKVANFFANHQAEKAYLQTDRPYYNAGDTLYFKAYVTLGEYHELSNLGSILHVDLINSASQIKQSRTLQIINGVAWGDFTLSDTLKKGQYRLRAYTQLMRNGNDNSFFNQAIFINSAVSSSNSAAVTLPVGKPDIGFFPEGGNLIEGVKSKVAFKAINADGLGINVKGVIVDNDNKEIVPFASTHIGMGYFEFTPAAGKSYKAKITYPNNITDVIALPATITKGVVLSLDDTGRYVTINLLTNNAYFLENKNKFYTVFVYCGGAVTTEIGIFGSKAIKLVIDKRKFPSGVGTVTLFSATGEPLAERLLFIKNNDALKLNITSDKPQYNKRENSTISLAVVDKNNKATEGHFSVSVIDQSKIPAGESAAGNILSHLLLTSDISGYVEKPAYYFNSANAKTDADLDVVMLTHGYRRFEWKKLLKEGYPANKYVPEIDLEIAGTAKTTAGKPLANTNVTITSKDNGRLFTKDTVTDDKGNFKFLRLLYTDNTRFLIKTKGGNNTVLTYRGEQILPVDTNIILDNVTTLTDLPEQNIPSVNQGITKAPAGKVLAEVKVNESQIREQNSDEAAKLIGNKIYYGKDMVKIGKFSEAIRHIGAGIEFKSSNKNPRKGIGKNPMDFINYDLYFPGATERVLVLLDGVEFQGNIDDINVDLVESIQVLPPHSESKGFYGALSRGEGGILVVSTDKNKGYNAKAQTGGTLFITPQGLYKGKEFYTPKYTPTNIAQAKADTRATIYWKPELLTDKNGTASITYPNADGPGNYLVIVEGMDTNGNIGSTRYTYKVQ